MKRIRILAIILLIVFTLSLSLSAVVAQDSPVSDDTTDTSQVPTEDPVIIIETEPSYVVYLKLPLGVTYLPSVMVQASAFCGHSC